MKTIKYLFAAVGMINAFQGVAYSANPKIDYVELTDNSTHAGTRQSRSKLKCVEKKTESGGVLDISLNALAGISGGSGTPDWSASAGSISGNGASATWTGEDDSTISASLSGHSASASLEVTSFIPQTIKFEKGTSGAEETQVGISNYLTGVQVTPAWSLSGKIEGTYDKCDFYNDGQKLGTKAKVSGTLSLKAPAKEAPFTAIPIGWGVQIKPFLKFNPFSLDVSVSFDYNEEKSNPWVDPVKGSIKVDVGGSAGARAQWGPEVANVGVTGSVDASLQGNGIFGSEDKNIRLESADFSLGKVTLTWHATIELLGGEYEFASDQYVVCNGWNYQVPNLPKVLYTIPS
jgi:hypothetical protein